MMHFIATLRSLSGGKPVGFKLCVGARTEFLSICKAMLAHRHHPRLRHRRRLRGRNRRRPTGIRGPRRHAADRGPDAGAQLPGRHRAARPHQDRRVGQGGQRRRHRQPHLPGRRLHDVGAGDDVRRRLHPGDEVQHQQMPDRRRHPGPGAGRGRCTSRTRSNGSSNFQRATVASAAQIVASMGLDGFDELEPSMLNRRIEGQRTRTYAEIYDWLMPGELLDDPPESWLLRLDRGLRRGVPLTVGLRRSAAADAVRGCGGPAAGGRCGEPTSAPITPSVAVTTIDEPGVGHDHVAERRRHRQQAVARPTSSGRGGRTGCPPACRGPGRSRARYW